MSRSAKAWMAAAWIGFTLLPWHMLSAGWTEWLVGLSTGGPPSAATLVLAGQAWGLGPIALPLMLATVPLFDTSRARDGRILIRAGLTGLGLITAQGFAVGLDGWTFRPFGTLFGTSGPQQAGMGLGAALTTASFLMLLCHGL